MQKKYLYFMAASHLAVDINSGSLPAILPFFVMHYGMNYTDVAGLTFAGSFLASVIQPLFGYLADKGSRQWFMGLGVLLASLSLASCSVITDYWQIFIAVTLLGIGSSIFHPEAARMVNAISAGGERASAMSIFSVGGNGGFGLGPVLAVALLSSFGAQGLAFYGILGLIMGTALFILAPRISRKAKSAQDADKPRTAAVTEGKKNDWRAFGHLLGVILFRSTIGSSIRSFLPLYCIYTLGVSHATGSITLSVLSVTAIFTTLIGGALADRWGYVAVLRRGCVLLIPALAAMVFCHNIWLIYALILPLSLGFNGTYSSIVVLGQTYLAKNVGFASGVTLGLAFSIGGIMVPLVGSFADSLGIEAAMTLVAALSVPCAIASFLLPPGKREAHGQ